LAQTRTALRTGAAALACAAAAVTTAGCSPTTHTSAPPTTTTTTTAPSPGSPSSLSPSQAAALVNCLQTQGLSIPAGKRATLEQIRTAFTAVPSPKRQAIYNACSTTIPAELRQQVQARIANKATTTTTTATAP
jgi:hypothetical protein